MQYVLRGGWVAYWIMLNKHCVESYWIEILVHRRKGKRKGDGKEVVMGSNPTRLDKTRPDQIRVSLERWGRSLHSPNFVEAEHSEEREKRGKSGNQSATGNWGMNRSCWVGEWHDCIVQEGSPSEKRRESVVVSISEGKEDSVCMYCMYYVQFRV